MEPKVLVSRYCFKQYSLTSAVGQDSIKSLTYKNYNILLVDNSADSNYSEKIKSLGLPVLKDIRLEDVKERITHSRNIIRKKVLEENYDYFLSLEQDVIPPKDVIERLLKHQKDIVSGVYYTIYKINGKKVTRPLLWAAVDNDQEMRFMGTEAKEGLTNPKLVEIKASGLGCILISRKVLEKIEFKSTKDTFDDIPFCLDAAKTGFKLYADTGVHCKHLLGGDHELR